MQLCGNASYARRLRSPCLRRNRESGTTCIKYNTCGYQHNLQWSKMRPPKLTPVYLVNNKRQLSHVEQYVPIKFQLNSRSVSKLTARKYEG